jgi:hypothetical protein
MIEPLEPRLLLTAATILSTDPVANSHDASILTNVSATFDQSLNPTTVTGQTFAVHGMQSGRQLDPPNTLRVSTVNVADDTIILDTAKPFAWGLFPGEIVQVTAGSGIENTLGEASNKSVWQFQTDVSSGTGLFEDTGQDLGAAFTWDVALGDLNGNGYLDAFVANGGNRDTVWLNDGSGNFTTAVSPWASATACLSAWAISTATVTSTPISVSTGPTTSC